MYQQFSFGTQNEVYQEVMKICSMHPACEECPLKEQDMTIGGSTVICETGRSIQN